MADPERFAKNSQGFYLEDHTVFSTEGFGLHLYTCRQCWALTTDPSLHDKWHTGGAA
jgi:hypothetical protein